MVKRRVINPTNKVASSEIIRFRGVIDTENEQMTPVEYVGSLDNLDSSRLREMTQRKGQKRTEQYSSEVHSGRRTLSVRALIAGTDLHVFGIVESLTPVAGINFIKPIIVTEYRTDGVALSKKFKTYQGSVFSHKRGSWGGMDQSHGDVYRGDAVEMALNLIADENLTQRDGQSFVESRTLISGAFVESGIAITSGTDLYFGTSYQEFL